VQDAATLSRGERVGLALARGSASATIDDVEGKAEKG